jgi:hypothetical protein
VAAIIAIRLQSGAFLLAAPARSAAQVFQIIEIAESRAWAFHGMNLGLFILPGA